MDPSEENQFKIPFVDAHHHLWDLNANKYAWLEGNGDPNTTNWIGEYNSIRCNYLIEDYLSDARSCGLVKSVHVQAGWNDENLRGETEWLQQLADVYHFPNAIVAEVDLRAPDVEIQLNLLTEYHNFRGVRMLPMNNLVNDPKFLRGLTCLDRLKLTYDLNTRVPYMKEGVELAQKFPDTFFMINNTGNPMERSKEYFQTWQKQISELAALPNVLVKISGLGMSDHAWTIKTIEPWILTVIDLFGTDRSMFATNWPVDRLYSTFKDLINAYHRITAPFSPAEKEAMFSANAERYYRI